MKLTISICIFIVATCFAQVHAEEIDVTDWSSVEILQNETLTARLRYRPVASVADKHWIVVEIENVSDRPLKPEVIWVEANISTKNLITNKPLYTGNLGGHLPAPPQIAPGETYQTDGGSLKYAAASLGALEDGMTVTGKLKYDIQLGEKRFTDYDPGAQFKFQWLGPNETEIPLMTKELKALLRDFENLDKNLDRIGTLMKSKIVVDKLSLTEDYLPVLNETGDANLRFLLLEPMFAKYADAPEVSNYYREAFKNDPESVYWDGAATNVWNPEFLEPLVQGCEQDNWKYFEVLRRHKKRWHDRPEIVARVSKALLKHHPILSQNTEDIPDDDLSKWANAIEQAADVEDKKLVKLFKPALSDRRDADICLGAGGIRKNRVCDHAMLAILTILDGDSFVAFKKAGFVEWKVEDKNKVYDPMIVVLQKRLAAPPENGSP
ncbi:hypothetical protein N9Y42_08880 [Mariniblastus sp.]|nr:hypothetical protein [Mariniblastus sp.]